MGYIDERIRPRIAWYDRRAVTCKRIRMLIDLGTTILSVALIVLIELSNFPRIGLSVVAGVIAIMIAVDKIGAYGEKWLQYRIAAEALESEIQLHANHAGPYSGDAGEADRNLVERVEAMLKREARSWLELSKTHELSFERKLGQ